MLMKRIVLSVVFLILVFSFTGCGKCPEAPVVEKLVYLKRPLPDLPKKPKGDVYTGLKIMFNGQEYVAFPKVDAAILNSNWISYKNWCETNEAILLKIKN